MRDDHVYPVFYDPHRLREKILRYLAGVIAIVFFLWGLLVAGYHLHTPDLPRLALAEPAGPSPARGAEAASIPAGYVPLEPAAEPGRRDPVASDATPPHLAFGFLTNGDPQGIDSLTRHLHDLDVVVPQWLYYDLDSGMLIEDDPGAREAVVNLLKDHAAAARLMPMVTNLRRGQWQGEPFAALLARADRRRSMVDQLVDYARSREFLGISVDFEQLPEAALPDYYAFLEELGEKLHAQGLQLSVNVPFVAETLAYARMAKAADYVIVMAYDEHWAGGKPGPIASARWLASRAGFFRATIPAGKLILALGNYALDWSQESPASPDTVEGALAKAREAGVRVRADPGSLNPGFRYRDPAGRDHDVWFLDAVTGLNAVTAFAAAHPAGYALWRLGMEDPSLWEFFARDRPLGPAAAARLERVSPAQVHYRGTGEVLRFTGDKCDGTRRLTRDPVTGLLHETYATLPAAYTLTRYGSAGKQVALTFDDGPSPGFTPPLLDLLDEAGVKATFFVIGMNGRENPGLLRRTADAGHEIGIHTFTHPDISLITPEQLDDELLQSQRMLETTLGRQAVLFRPPFGRDMNPSAPEHLRPVEQVTRRGYLTVGMRVDTNDWASPGEDEILQAALDQVHAGGRIILMHDGGGDRHQTLRAVPRLIAELRREGYMFVTVSDLLHLSPDEVMPHLSRGQAVEAAAAGAAGRGLGGFLWFIQGNFVVGLVLGFARMALIAAGALVHRRRERRRPTVAPPPLSLAVLVPAHNEAKVVTATVRSLLASEGVHPFDILVIDDGSTDDTYRRTRETFAGDPRVRVYTKPNGGKSSALNFGLLRTTADIVVMLDADTVFQRDTLRRLVARFADPAVGAVAGNVKVGNRLNLLTRWQALEYITSQSLDRRALTTINCNNVVPGAIGAWRRPLVMEVGMYNHRTLAEDADLTLSVCRKGYRIEYEPLAIAHTEAPDTLHAFLKQRFRWGFGTLQCAAKHLPALWSRKHPWLGFVGIPNMILFQVFFPLLAPFMDLVILLSMATMAYARLHHRHVDTLGTWEFLAYYLLFLAADAASATLAFALEKKEDYRLLAWVPFQRVFYRFVMYYVGVKSVAAALSGRAVGWGTLQRKATVAAAVAEPEGVLVES
jgi:cellulose synthase/poly-beta-1,6-N-acetylglucosamine synthase-like glycosyltransferase/peptidoglycan/xylan/chitin deacetylase (PgdA/CDA1 family)/spore germination protein YaaH